MTPQEKRMLDEYTNDKERLRNFILFVVGLAIGTITAILILNN